MCHTRFKQNVVSEQSPRVESRMDKGKGIVEERNRSETLEIDLRLGIALVRVD